MLRVRSKSLSSYHLSPQQLQEIHRKYGRPGELAPGRPATRKRNRLYDALAAMDRKDNLNALPTDDGNDLETDIT